MSSQSSVALNIKQNRPDFALEPLDEQPPIFKFKYCSKTLNEPKDNPEDLEGYRTVTVKCLMQGCK
jgi:hypothetical protein